MNLYEFMKSFIKSDLILARQTIQFSRFLVWYVSKKGLKMPFFDHFWGVLTFGRRKTALFRKSLFGVILGPVLRCFVVILCMVFGQVLVISKGYLQDI